MKQQDKTCVPVVEATPEQRETLHQKAIGLFALAGSFHGAGKHKETKIEYELMLRQDGDEILVDLRRDKVGSDGEIFDAEYIEGFIFDHWSLKKNYGDAVTKFLELRLKYPDAYESDEILEEAKDLLAVRYGNGIYDAIAEVAEIAE